MTWNGPKARLTTGHTKKELRLDYGTDGLCLDIAGLNATVLRPRFVPGLQDERSAFIDALRNPIGAPPLSFLVRPLSKVAVVIPDVTRPFPGARLLPWFFKELSQVAPKNVTIITGTGTHRACTAAEIAQMVGEDIAERYAVVNHDCRDKSTMVRAGRSPFGYEVYVNQFYAQADIRVLMGFIEPHFMAGFSGGYKAVFPGIVDLEAIKQYHSYDNIAHPRSTWGVLENNPTQEHVRAGGRLLDPEFLINVTLNSRRAITGYYCGDVINAHEVGCAFSCETAMAGVSARFPITVTSNSGYPLDQNLYQSVKGMTAADAITEPGGLIICAARCNDGFPEHGAFKEQLFRHTSPDRALAGMAKGRRILDGWQTQKLLQICRSKRVQLYSTLQPAEVAKAHIQPIDDVRDAIDQELARIGDPQAPVAILPEGPLTIPYLRS